MRRRAFIICLAVLTGVAAIISSRHSALGDSNQDVLMGRVDNNRTGAFINETTLTPANVNVNNFGKLAARPVIGDIYAQPLYVSAVNIPGQGTHNVVYVATAHNIVYAFDADDTSAAGNTPLWSIDFSEEGNVGLPPMTSTGPGGGLCTCDVWDGEVGILSTPVIDPNTQTMYVVSQHNSGSNQAAHYLHALDITTGAEKFGGPVLITGTVIGNGQGSANGNLTVSSYNELQRPALTLLNGNVYVAMGATNDRPPWHGWVFGYNASNLTQQAGVYTDTANGGGGGIWSDFSVATDGTYLYVSTGNGTFDINSSGATGPDYGDSILKLDPSGGQIQLADWWVPSNEAYMDQQDLDMGVTGPVLIPGTNYLIAGGKQGWLEVLNRGNLGHYVGPNPPSTSNQQPNPATDTNVIQEFDTYGGSVSHMHNSPVFWNGPNGPVIYSWTEQDYVKAYQFSLTNPQPFNTVPFSVSQSPVVGTGMPPGVLSLSANGSQNGIVWAYENNGSYGNRVGALYALDANDLTKMLWSSKQNAARDAVGTLGKFNPPVIANGKVFVGTFALASKNGGTNPASTAYLDIYGLLPPPPTATNTSTNTPTATSTSTNSATPTATPTNTATSTPIVVFGASDTPTDTATSTATVTDTPTNTAIPTDTATNTDTATSTLTPSDTPTQTATNTNTSTPTNTPTQTATNTSTSTPSNTPTQTATNTSTLTPSNTPTPTNTPTQTATNTSTPTPRDTPTQTATNTSTLTPSNTTTHTATNTSTPTPSNTPTNTLTPSNTPTHTATNTSTPTPSNTPTNTLTPSNTPTHTATNTSTPTPSNTPTNTLTPSNTPTQTATNTNTSTPSNTPTHTATDTSTSTPSYTPTLTATRTATKTRTPTLTKTNTPSQTPEPTGTSTPTVTATDTPPPQQSHAETFGVYRTSAGLFLLRNSNTTGYADITFTFRYGSNPYPVVGNWLGSGLDTAGLIDKSNAQFFLRNVNAAGNADEQFVLGNPGDEPIAGQWTINGGHDGVGVFRPSNGLLLFRNQLSTGYADYVMVLGIPGDEGLAGDWSGQGHDSPGVYRPSNQLFLLSNTICGYCSVYADYTLQFGNSGDNPVTGDWIGQGHAGAGVFRPTSGLILLKNQLTTGYADIVIVYGIPNDVPIAGHWATTAQPIVRPPNILVPATTAPVATSMQGSGNLGG